MSKTVLVLGGGGVKGMAHIGALRALSEYGVSVDEIVGTSIGALVGSAYAGGATLEALESRAKALRRSQLVTINRWAVLLNGIRQQSVFRGDVFAEYVKETLPVDSFEELTIPVTVNGVDLATGDPVWMGSGGDREVSISTAVTASCALPVFYPPVEVNGKWVVDGGIADALPITFAASRGADRIIAVDVSAGGERDATEVVSQGMVAIQHRVTEIMAAPGRAARLIEWSGPPLTYVRPRIDGYNTFDFGHTAYFIEEGYRATKEALDVAPAVAAG